MYLRVDTRQVPPTIEVCDEGDFSGFKLVVVTSTHAWVPPDALTELAGRADDHAWKDKLAAMISYAERRGWTDDHGRIRAHVEFAAADVSPADDAS